MLAKAKDARAVRWDPDIIKITASLQFAGGQRAVDLVNGRAAQRTADGHLKWRRVRLASAGRLARRTWRPLLTPPPATTCRAVSRQKTAVEHLHGFD